MQEELKINTFKNEIEYKESITVDGLITLYEKKIFTNIICDADKQIIYFDEREVKNFQKNLEMILEPVRRIVDEITKKVALALKELGEIYNDYIANLGNRKENNYNERERNHRGIKRFDSR